MLERTVSHIKPLYVLVLDGSVCEQEWLRYNWSYYIFYTDEVLNFSDAGAYCISHKAFICLGFRWFCV